MGLSMGPRSPGMACRRHSDIYPKLGRDLRHTRRRIRTHVPTPRSRDSSSRIIYGQDTVREVLASHRPVKGKRPKDEQITREHDSHSGCIERLLNSGFEMVLCLLSLQRARHHVKVFSQKGTIRASNLLSKHQTSSQQPAYEQPFKE